MGQSTKHGIQWWQILLIVVGVLGIGIFVLCTTTGIAAIIIASKIFSPPLTPYPRGEPVREPPPVATVDVQMLRLSLDDYPRVDGSTSAQPLAVLVACKALGVSHRWGTKLDGSRWMEPYTTTVAMGPAVGWISGHVVHNGTHESYVNLIEGRTDLVLVARAPSPDEEQLAQAAGVTLDVRPVAVDAFIFLLHQDNPLDGLTLDQLRAIYAGQIVSWQEVGGPDAKINAYQRNPNSGSQELMLDLVMQGTALAPARSEMIGMSMTGPYNQMHSDPQGIAYSIYYYKEQMAPQANVKVCAVDGVAPTREHIADRSYPLSAEVYVVVRRDLPAGSSARVLRDWLLSAEGQAVVEESGYVPVR